MKKKTGVQYTIRQVPETIDDALRKLAVREGTSLNAVALGALRAGSGTDTGELRFHDLDNLAGTWVTDPAFDKAVEAFKTIDEGLWK
jgi:hypothetical protein